MNEYRFERITEKHYKDLRYISNSAFNIKPPLSYYFSKNKTSPFGEPCLGYIAYHVATNEPAAFYGVYAYPFIYKGERYFIVQSGDTMTHKKHTGKGLFIRLAKMTYDLAREKGAYMVFGFPNSNSYPGFVKKLDWTHRDNMSVYNLKVRTLPLLKLAKKFPVFNLLYRLYLKLVHLFFKANKEVFPNSVIQEDVGGIEHSHAFFQYKKFSGNFVICINNTHVWLKPDGFLFIGDIERKENPDVMKIIKGIKLYAFLIGADVIRMGFSPNSFWNKKFKTYFESEEGLAFGYLLFKKEFPIEHFEYSMADLDTF
jgi:hypothetical protein